MTALWDEVRAGWQEAAKLVGRHRQWVEPTLRPHRLWLRRAKVPIAVTGLPGAGKSVFRDAVVGRSGGLGYRTVRSVGSEQDRVLLRGRSGGFRAGFLVLPGQESAERSETLRKTLDGRNAPEGLIHVVSFGYLKLWRHAEDGALRRERITATEADKERFRTVMLESEIEDFADVCDRLKATAVQRRLRWMIVVVAKSDLFWSNLDAARDHYIPGGGAQSSGFVQLMEGLTSGNRSVPPRIAVVPFSGYPEAHRYAEGLFPTPSQLDMAQASALRESFYQTLDRVQR